jgi:hypothetical protein
MSRSSFPSILDTFSSPTPDTLLGGDGQLELSHAEQHAMVIDTLSAIQSTIGTQNSEDVSSIEYRLTNHTHNIQWNQIINPPSFDVAQSAQSAQYAQSAQSAQYAQSAQSAVQVNTGSWHIFEQSGALYFSFNGSVKDKLESTGDFTTAGDIIGLGL